MAIKGTLTHRVKRHAPYANKSDAIRGRRIWLSGGARGLGLCFAKALLSHGCAALALVDIAEPSAGAAIVSELLASRQSTDQRVKYYHVDVRDPRRLTDSLLDAALSFGGLDTVVNNAGVADERELDATVAVNLVAVVRATEAALDAFEEVPAGEGAERVIVNVASAGGVVEMPIAPIYSASKFGVVGYTKSMRNACDERGVRIMCFCPAWADTGMGKTVSRMGVTARYTGIMRGEDVAECLVEMIRRRDLVGEAVYVSKVTGPRLVMHNISTRMRDFPKAKL